MDIETSGGRLTRLAFVTLEFADPFAHDDVREIGHDVPSDLPEDALRQSFDDKTRDRVDIGG
jgi:hypothetical protein